MIEHAQAEGWRLGWSGWWEGEHPEHRRQLAAALEERIRRALREHRLLIDGSIAVLETRGRRPVACAVGACLASTCPPGALGYDSETADYRRVAADRLTADGLPTSRLDMTLLEAGYEDRGVARGHEDDPVLQLGRRLRAERVSKGGTL